MGLSDKQKGFSMCALLRDFLVNALPSKITPKFLVNSLYGKKVDFIFLVHPRHKEDIYKTVPLLKFITRFIPEKFILKILTKCPAYVIAKSEWKERDLRGLIVSTSIMPDELLIKRDNTLSELKRIVSFIKKIATGKVYVGLAAWWPIVTNSGLAFQRVLEGDDNIAITNGHTATLVSIYLMVKHICGIADTKLDSLKILIIGIGKMGSAVAEIFNGKVKELGIIDRNEMRLRGVENYLSKKKQHSSVSRYVATDSLFSERIFSILSDYDITICTTSNVNYIIKDSSALRKCIVIDDSRPEAFPRVIDENRNAIVLEGGIIKLKGIELDDDFGFGKKDNVFGCMAEALILAADEMRSLKPVIGEIDYNNFYKMLAYCRKHDIGEGDFKSGQKEVSLELVKKIINNKRTAKTK